MRKSMVIAVALLSVVASAFAQKPARSNSVSLFVSDLSVFHSSAGGTTIDAGYGAAFAHMFSNRVSGELSVTSERFQRYVSTFETTGVPTTYHFSHQVYPIDANVSYHFLNDSRWKPYFGGGVRYLSDTVHFQGGPLGSQDLTSRRVDPEVSGGVTYQFRPALGLRFDAKQVIGSNRGYVADSDFKASVGLAYRF